MPSRCSSYAFLQPHLEVVHWASYHVGGVTATISRPIEFMNCTWSTDEYLHFQVTPKEIIAYIQVRWPSRPQKIIALRNDKPRKHFSQNCHGSSRSMSSGPVLLINSTSVNFWCEKIMQHVTIATGVYCHSMSVQPPQRNMGLSHQSFPHSTRLSHIQSEEGTHEAAVDLRPTNNGSYVC
jgi:hypothetical protein